MKRIIYFLLLFTVASDRLAAKEKPHFEVGACWLSVGPANLYRGHPTKFVEANFGVCFKYLEIRCDLWSFQKVDNFGVQVVLPFSSRGIVRPYIFGGFMVPNEGVYGTTDIGGGIKVMLGRSFGLRGEALFFLKGASTLLKGGIIFRF